MSANCRRKNLANEYQKNNIGLVVFDTIEEEICTFLQLN